ncbi:tetratricopeptide repeat protein [Devosia psychrophila]|uniref:TPR repeat n=1 Tax=Devosia psychrophila TaxID=728005 RepID=A0A0F5Q1J9_9HYPH|nr:tetratricopeptide repeat protein [Devosia psychrophila]KKC33954.1 hypothetical protein WH91_05710 [Devosia psychrophila]SFD18075.1 hypothetical protein SAMN04488059_12620 [Devosia psychrophila]
MNIFRVASIASLSLMMLTHAAPAQDMVTAAGLPPLAEARGLSDTEKLALAEKTLLGDLRLPDYGFPILLEMSARGNREAIRLLARAIVNNEYSFGDDIERVRMVLGSEAMLGSSSAVMAWATIQDRGVDVVKNETTAYEWYRWAAIVGSESGRRATALALISGKGVERNVDEALEWANRLPAVRRSSTYIAMAELLYASHQTGDVELADRLAVESASLNPDNTMRAANLLLESSGSPAALTEASRIVAEAAAAGDAKALVMQANLAEQGSDPQARVNAIENYITLANANNAEAIKQLARLLSSGSLPAPKLDEIVEILITQANAGNIEAIVAISQAYMFGAGVPVSFEKAAQYYRMGAELGNAEAQYQIGILYAGGIGVSRDVELAKSWLQKSALGGSQVAAVALRSMQ